MFRLPIVKFFSRILNRFTITVVLVALQVAWLLWAFFSLTTGRVWVNAGLQLLSLFMMLYLVRKDENSAYKIGWIALMGVLPLLGGALYLSFGNKRPAKQLRSKLQAVDEAHKADLAQQPGQSLLHHEVQGGDHAAQDRPRHILKPEVIQGEQVHQVDADLVCGLAAVRVQGCPKPQLLVPVKQPHRGVGVSYINGQQHKPLSFFLPILIVFYGITPCRRMQGRDRGKIFR